MGQQRIELRGTGEWERLSWASDTRLCIGRTNTCEAVIDEPSVSRRHAEILHTSQGWVIRDLGSTNGTLLNGVRLGRVDQRLQRNDLIRPGDISLVVAELIDDAEPASFCSLLNDGILFEVRGELEREEQCEKPAVFAETLEGRLLPSGKVASPPFGRDSMESLLHSSLQDAVHSLGAQRGVILLTEENSQKLNLHAAYSRTDCGERDYHNKKLTKSCFLQRKSLLCESIRAAALDAAHISGVVGVRGILCVLLGRPDQPLGVLHLDRSFAQAPFTMQDLQAADAFGASMSVGIQTVKSLLKKERRFFMQTVLALAQAVDCRDRYTAGHTQRVTDYALLLAEELQVSSEDYHNLQIGTPLHDIGKIGIDDAVLRKSGQLSPEGFLTVRRPRLAWANSQERYKA